MTTVAWDGKTLACDSMISRGEIAYRYGEKLIKLDSGAYIAGAGLYADLLKFRDFMNDPDGDPPKIEDINLIMVHPDGKAYEYYNGFTKEPAPRMAAQGTGWQIALAVMMHGGTAIEAVEIASRLDKNTGGEVMSFTVSSDHSGEGEK